MVKCCSDHSCKYNHGTGYYGICKHPSMENAVGYGGIDRILVETCGNKEKETAHTCSVCGKELPPTLNTDKCLDCAKKSLQQTFKENPELGKAFKETIEELRKPENVSKMAEDTVKFMKTVQDLKDSQGCRNCEFQPSPMQTCDWLRTETTVHMICPRWKKRGNE